MFQSDGEMIPGVHPVDAASQCAVHPAAEIDVIQMSVEAGAAGMQPSSCSGLTTKWHAEVSLRPLQATMLADAPLVKGRAARSVTSLGHQFAEFAGVLGPTR